MASAEPRRLYVAKWSTRFWAWLVDVVVVGAVVNAFAGALGALAVWSPPYLVGQFGGVSGLGLWLYWTLLEGHGGQSIGKFVVNVEVTDRRGDPIGYGTAAVESFGKAFLLPLDVLVGVLAYEGRKLRLFNRLSGTVVVETEPDPLAAPEGVEYVLPEDR
jgi:uncharacterized RDD family membrane protein YckC